MICRQRQFQISPCFCIAAVLLRRKGRPWKPYFAAAVALSLCFILRAARNRGGADISKKSIDLGDEQLTGVERQIAYFGKDHINSSQTKPSKIVLIYATKRSGSSLLGELFNQNRGCFYLFEPLFPFSRDCDYLLEERGIFLSKLANCDFSTISHDYAEVFKVTHHTDERSKCMRHTLCFTNHNPNVLYRYASACKNPGKGVDFQRMSRFIADSKCGYPLNTTLLSRQCEAAQFIAFKIIRLCGIRHVETVFKALRPREKRATVIHLVRDPRAILSSRLLLDNDELTRQNLESVARNLCKTMSLDVNYAKFWQQGDFQENVKEVQVPYMLVRYEDLTVSPLEKAYAIYRFLGIELPIPVKLWIHNSFLGKGQKNKASKDPYSTKKQGFESLNAWRKNLSLEDILLIQKHCKQIMEVMNYRAIFSEEEKNDWNLTVW